MAERKLQFIGAVHRPMNQPFLLKRPQGSVQGNTVNRPNLIFQLTLRDSRLVRVEHPEHLLTHHGMPKSVFFQLLAKPFKRFCLKRFHGEI